MSFLFISFAFLFADINYFHCIRIVELLKVSESATKNIFGGYSSKRMKVCVSLSWMTSKYLDDAIIFFMT